MSISEGQILKFCAAQVLWPFVKFWRVWVVQRWMRLWSFARLQEGIGRPLHSSNVVMGPVELQGTCNVTLGRGALFYPGVYLETQGQGRIEIGNDVVLSTGVHIVAFELVRLGDGVMVGEYSSLRDANHNRSDLSMRHSGHNHSAIEVARNVWIAKGVTILKGVILGEGAIVGANAVVTRNVPPASVVAGVPASPVQQRRPS